jgi:host factor-I protein
VDRGAGERRRLVGVLDSLDSRSPEERTMEADASSIQNEFFNRARKERALLTVSLMDGTRVVGRLRAFDKFTILVDTTAGDQMLFKHAIASVAPQGEPPSA